MTRLLAACGIRTESRPSATLQSACAPVVCKQSPLSLCSIYPAYRTIRAALAPPGSETPLRSLLAFSSVLSEVKHERVLTAINAGMSDSAGVPQDGWIPAPLLVAQNRAEAGS